MPEFNTSHFVLHLEKVVKDAENQSGDLKSLVRMLKYLADNKASAPSDICGTSLFTFVNLVLRAHKKTYSSEDFGHAVRTLAAINPTYASTLAQNKNLSP
jgi:hypothetical protein